MIVLKSDFDRLKEGHQRFLIDYGAFNCVLVKLNTNALEIMEAFVGREMPKSLKNLITGYCDGNWHIAYKSQCERYVVCGCEGIVYTQDCIEEIKNDIGLNEPNVISFFIEQYVDNI